ncbi:hypothetical protein GJ496_011174 [Pomphorhynchus laevis]|nr:hypothetical protein GJ496_011174 [Pomphorhynchus laevis]
MNFFDLPFHTHMDFVGQKRAERLYQIIIAFCAFIGFIHGFIKQQASIPVYYTLFGSTLSILLTVPPWPFYRMNPLKWQKEKRNSDRIKLAEAQISSRKVGKSKKKKPRRNNNPSENERKVTFAVVDSEGKHVPANSEYLKQKQKFKLTKAKRPKYSDEELEARQIKRREKRKQLKDREISAKLKLPMDKWPIVVESSLRRMATKGVVQLFNAVKKRQSMINKLEKSGIPEYRKEKIIKSQGKGEFLDLIRKIGESADKTNAERAGPVPDWLNSLDT